MNKKAFTLIELLVVIVILGVLAAFLFPAMGRIRESARTAFCANNLRQVGLAMHLYIDEHEGIIPVRLRRWHNELASYLDNSGDLYNDEIYVCPSNKSTLPSYHMNEILEYPQPQPAPELPRFFRISNPSETIYIYDSDTTWTYYNWDGGIYDPSYAKNYFISDRHTGGANILWVDGHVSWHPEDVIADTEEWWYP